MVTISDCNKQAMLEKNDTLDKSRIEVIRFGIDPVHGQEAGGRTADQVVQIMSVGSLIEK